METDPRDKISDRLAIAAVIAIALYIIIIKLWG